MLLVMSKVAVLLPLSVAAAVGGGGGGDLHGGVHVVEAPVDYSENQRVLIDELAARVCLV